MKRRRPNILLITTDQQRHDHLGVAGVRGIDTPNLDRLAREGIHFSRAYTPSPLCTPARLSLLTGRYPSAHRGYSIGVSVDPFPRPTLPGLLSEAGYATALIGKAHFVRREDEEQHFAGLDYASPPPPSAYYENHTGPYVGFDYVQTDKGHTTNHIPGMHYRRYLEERGVDYLSWYPDVTDGHDHSEAGIWNIPEEYHDTRWVTDRTIEWIRANSGNRTENGETRPWFIWASYQDPHEPFVCPEPWYSSVRMNEVELFEEVREGEFDDKPRFYGDAYRAGFGTVAPAMSAGAESPDQWKFFDDGHGIPSAFNRTDLAGKERLALQATLGMVAFIDRGVGDILQALDDTGDREETLVVFTTDHGELHGHHGLWHKGLFAYEDCQRVPMIVWGPNRVAPTGTSKALVNLVDLPRTFLDEAGVETPQGMQGLSLQPLLRGEVSSVQDATIIELEATQRVYQQTLVTERYKLVLYRDFDSGELYDLEEDPDQYRNLWTDSHHRLIREKLLQRFVQTHMRREGSAQPRLSFA